MEKVAELDEAALGVGHRPGGPGRRRGGRSGAARGAGSTSTRHGRTGALDADGRYVAVGFGRAPHAAFAPRSGARALSHGLGVELATVDAIKRRRLCC